MKYKLIAMDKINEVDYEFRIGPGNMPDAPRLTHMGQMRRKGSDNEWESAMTGLGISRKAALKKFVNNFYHIGSLESLVIMDNILKLYVDKKIAIDKKRDTKKVKEEKEKLRLEKEEHNKYIEKTKNNILIKKQMLGAKAKIKNIKIIALDNQLETAVVEIDKAKVYGDYAFHNTYKSVNYTVTHIPSRKWIKQNLKYQEARELAYRCYVANIKWDGIGDIDKMPEVFKEAIYKVFGEFENRELIII